MNQIFKLSRRLMQKVLCGFRYKSCMQLYPPDHDDCNVMLWYPDFDWDGEFCVLF